MPEPKLSEKLREKSPEEYIVDRVADINSKKGFLYAQAHPQFSAIEKEREIAIINELCDKIEMGLPRVEELIRKIFPHIKSITEQTKVVAAYMLIGKAYSNLQTALLACRNGKNIEAMELSRSGKEALDLTVLFWENENQSSLKNWFKGKIITNADAREFQHKYLNKGLAGTAENEERPIKEMLVKGYKVMSVYTHSGYAGLLDSIDVFKLDFDFEAQAGYHYCVNNFHVVEDLLIKILLNLKNAFLHLEDNESFIETDKLYRPFDPQLTKEQMGEIISKYKNTPEGKPQK